MAHNALAESQREQSRLIFNGPGGCSSNWQGFSLRVLIHYLRDFGKYRSGELPYLSYGLWPNLLRSMYV